MNEVISIDTNYKPIFFNKVDDFRHTKISDWYTALPILNGKGKPCSMMIGHYINISYYQYNDQVISISINLKTATINEVLYDIVDTKLVVNLTTKTSLTQLVVTNGENKLVFKYRHLVNIVTTGIIFELPFIVELMNDFNTVRPEFVITDVGVASIDRAVGFSSIYASMLKYAGYNVLIIPSWKGSITVLKVNTDGSFMIWDYKSSSIEIGKTFNSILSTIDNFKMVIVDDYGFSVGIIPPQELIPLDILGNFVDAYKVSTLVHLFRTYGNRCTLLDIMKKEGIDTIEK